MKRFSLFIFPLLFLGACSDNAQQKKVNKSNPFYERAKSFAEIGEIDSSFKYYDKAKEVFFLQRDTLSAGKCLVNMGGIAESKRDYFGGLEISLSAIKCFDETKTDQYSYISFNYNNLGRISYQLKDYTSALKFYDEAMRFILVPSSKLICLNNKAKVFEEQKKYNKAISIYDQILNQTHSDKKEYARVLANIAYAKWLQNPNYDAAPELLKSLNIRKQENDLDGLNYCFARLADFYAIKNPSYALTYAIEMYQIAKQNNSPYDQLEALYKLIRLSPSKESKSYFVIYEKLDDSLQTDRTFSKNQFALIRYETEKHKADNLVLQKENVEKNYLLITGVMVIIVSSVLGIIWYKRRKQALQQQAQNAIRENQLRTSKKVHDVVANGLYRIINKLDNQSGLQDPIIIDEMELLYEKSRNISYEDVHIFNENFQQKITNLLNSFANRTIKIVHKGNNESLWTNVSPSVKYEIEHILQELMVNMKKHSSSSVVTVKFEKTEKIIHIYYVDNGIGLPDDIQFKNGLSNTENRIKNISGMITFDTQNEKGLRIHISFPIS